MVSPQTFAGHVLVAVNPLWSRKAGGEDKPAVEEEETLYSSAMMNNFALNRANRQGNPHVFAVAQEAFR